MKTEFTITEGSPLTKEKLKQRLYVISYYFIAVVLLLSGISKILNPEILLNTLNTTLTFLSGNIIIIIATTLPVIEIALGLMLILPVPMGKIWRSHDKSKVKEILFVATMLFAIFLVFAIYGTIKGFDVDCGCFGSSVSSEFGAGMIIINVILLVITLLLNKTSLLEQKKSINNYFQTKPIEVYYETLDHK